MPQQRSRVVRRTPANTSVVKAPRKSTPKPTLTHEVITVIRLTGEGCYGRTTTMRVEKQGKDKVLFREETKDQYEEPQSFTCKLADLHKLSELLKEDPANAA